MIDIRPRLSEACARAQVSPTWVTAFGSRLLLASANVAKPGEQVVFVYHGEFGLGTLVDKDGLRIVDPQWLRPGRRGAGPVRIQVKHVRASVIQTCESSSP